ncbi:MAG: hypothetical protein IPN71_14740 [Fibrobacteres bacterium]|nr:hypothetical protein [Fibrobacterota bacterium]
MRLLSLIALALLVSCKQNPPSPEASPAPASSSAPAAAPTPEPFPEFPQQQFLDEPADFFPEFGLVLFDNCILLDTNGLRYSIVGQAKMLNQDLSVAKVDTNSLHQDWLDLLGESFTIYTPSGEDRRVTIKSFRIVSVASDDADVFREVWERHPDHKLTEDEFQNPSTAHLLVAVFEPFDSSMRSPSLRADGENLRWARLSKLGKPRFSKPVEQDEAFQSRMDKFIRRSEIYRGVDTEYRQYTKDSKSQDEGRDRFPETWFEYAAIDRSQFRLAGRDLGFVSLKSRDNCGGPGFTEEMNVLTWTKDVQFPYLADLPATALGQHRLIYAWDNEAKGNLDLLFSDDDEIVTFVRILPDGTTQSFSLTIPVIGPKC